MGLKKTLGAMLIALTFAATHVQAQDLIPGPKPTIGTLHENSRRLPNNYPKLPDHPYDIYRLTVEKNNQGRVDPYTITMRKAGTNGLPDPYLIVIDKLGKIVASDDDSGGGLDAKISSFSPEPGTYYVIASSFIKNKLGQYHITVSRGGIFAGGDDSTPRVKVLLVGLTDDQTLGQMIEVSLRKLRDTLRGIPNLRDQDIIELRGSQVNAANILGTVERMTIRADETLLCYYIGHGAYDPDQGGAEDRSGGHFFAIPSGDLMRKDLTDRLRAKRARLTVLISDTCNVRAVARPRAAVEARIGTGENPVLRDLLLRHLGFVDVSGSSRDQFGWFSLNTGAGSATPCPTHWPPLIFADPRSSRGTNFSPKSQTIRAAISNAIAMRHSVQGLSAPNCKYRPINGRKRSSSMFACFADEVKRTRTAPAAKRGHES